MTATPTAADAPGALTALAALSVLLALVTAGTFASLGVVLPDMVASQGWSWSQAGLGYTVMGVACGLSSLAPAPVIRTLGVRATLLLGGAIAAAGFVCVARARGVQLYLAGAALEGIGLTFAALIPGTYVLARRFAEPGRAYGLYYMAGGLGSVAGPWMYRASRALDPDWRAYWWAFTLTTLACSAVAAAVIGPTPKEPESVDGPRGAGFGVAAALRTPQFWVVTLAYSTYLLAETTVSALSVAHLSQRGVAAATAGGVLSLQALLNAVSRAGAGALAERVGPRRLASAALGLTAAGLAALAFARGWPLMLVYAGAVGVGYGVSFVATSVLLLQWFGRARNLELFSVMALVSTVAAAGPWLGGLSHDRLGGFGPAFLGFAAVALALAGALAVTPPPRPRGGPLIP